MSNKQKSTPRKEIKYTKVDADEKEATIPNKPKLDGIHSCNDLLNWMMHKPLSKLSFFYFFISIFIPPILAMYYIADNDAAFIISGIFGIGSAVYALNHFRLLLGLKNEVDRTSRLNGQFGTQNALLTTQVNRVESAKFALQETHRDLVNINKKQRENNEAFRTIQKNLKAANLDNIDGIQEIRSKAGKISEHWTVSLHNKERNVLFTVFERFELKDDSVGMSKEEFDAFCAMVPDVYQDRFNRLGTFKKLAGGKSYIDYQDFQSCLDVYHAMNVQDIDMDFKIECHKKVKKPKKMSFKAKLLSVPSSIDMDEEDGMPQFFRQISITKRSMPGVKFSPSDIEYDNSILFSDDEESDND